MLAAVDNCSGMVFPAVMLSFWLIRWAMRSSAESAGERRERTFRPRPPPPPPPPPPEEEIEVDPGWDQGDEEPRPPRTPRRRPPPRDARDDW